MLLGIFVYFRIRGLTASRPDVALAHARDIVALEHRLGIDVEGILQAPVVDSAKLSAVANWVYIYGHWPVIVVTMVWTVWRHHDVFLRLRDAMLVSGALGMAVFVSYPVAPPRLAGLGLVDTVTEQSHAYRILQPPQFVNQYAAMPSLHAGWDLLVGIADLHRGERPAAQGGGRGPAGPHDALGRGDGEPLPPRRRRGHRTGDDRPRGRPVAGRARPRTQEAPEPQPQPAPPADPVATGGSS